MEKNTGKGYKMKRITERIFSLGWAKFFLQNFPTFQGVNRKPVSIGRIFSLNTHRLSVESIDTNAHRSLQMKNSWALEYLNEFLEIRCIINRSIEINFSTKFTPHSARNSHIHREIFSSARLCDWNSRDKIQNSTSEIADPTIQGAPTGSARPPPQTSDIFE